MLRAAFFSLLCALLVSVAPAEAQQFGGSVALVDDQILVGEVRNATLSGLVYVYAKEGDAWVAQSPLSVTEELRSPDGFGRALAFDRGLLAVGAPLIDGNGAVFLFQSDGSGGWSQVDRIDHPEGIDGARFGSALAWSAGALIVGAPADGNGSITTFQRQEDGWVSVHTLRGPDGDAAPNFGTQFVTNGFQLIATAPGSRGADGTVYSFQLSPEGWRSVGTLTAPDLPARSGFGSALAIAEGAAFVGAPGVDNRTGRVFVYDILNGSPGDDPVMTLGPMVADANARFGSALSVRNEAIWIGSPGTAGIGAAYTFNTRQAAVGVVHMIAAAGMEAGASVGGYVAASRNLAVVAATGVDEGSGAAVVYEREGASWRQAAILTNPPRGFPAIAGDEIECVDGQASLFDCQDVNITAFLPIGDLGGSRGTRVNDVWGWTDPDSGIEYVIVGRTNGTSFVDISDPYNPVYVGDLPKTEGTRTTIWRDMKVYANHVYIVADAAGEHGVQVFDLTQLRTFDGTPITFEETFRYDEIHSAHNIVINEETGYAYAVGNSGGGETCGGGLHMISLENPSRPEFAGCFAEIATGRRGTGYSHDAQCVVYRGPDTEHQGKEVCFGSNETALNIADVSDKSAPVSIATASYPSVAYAHQGWLTEDHTFFYMNDEGDEPQGLVEGTRTLVWDVTDLDDPILVKEHIATTTATDHNLYVKGDRMYQSNYSAGFRVLDVSNPADPVEIGFFDTSPYEGGASWSNYPFFESGIIAVTGTGDGLFLVRDMARRNLIP